MFSENLELRRIRYRNPRMSGTAGLLSLLDDAGTRSAIFYAGATAYTGDDRFKKLEAFLQGHRRPFLRYSLRIIGVDKDPATGFNPALNARRVFFVLDDLNTTGNGFIGTAHELRKATLGHQVYRPF